MSGRLPEMDVIIDTNDRDLRENFPYDEFRQAVGDLGIDVWRIRFVR